MNASRIDNFTIFEMRNTIYCPEKFSYREKHIFLHFYAVCFPAYSKCNKRLQGMHLFYYRLFYLICLYIFMNVLDNNKYHFQNKLSNFTLSKSHNFYILYLSKSIARSSFRDLNMLKLF